MSPREKGISRRTFLKGTSAAAAGTAVALGLGPKGHGSLDEWHDFKLRTGPGVVNVLALADIHSGDLTDDQPGKITSKSEDSLSELQVKTRHLPIDASAFLGDLIQEALNSRRNKEKMLQILFLLQQFPGVIIPTLGNHDVWGLSDKDIQEIVEELNFMAPFYGVTPFPQIDTQIIHLSTEAQKWKTGRVPDASLALLEQNLHLDIPTIIMCHYSPVPFEDSRGYPYPNLNTAYTNWKDLVGLLAGYPIRAIFHGHAHVGHEDSYDVLKDNRGEFIPVIGLMSFLENLTSTQVGYNPGIYYILELTKEFMRINELHRGMINHPKRLRR